MQRSLSRSIQRGDGRCMQHDFMEAKSIEHFYNRMVVKVEACREVKEENDQKADGEFNKNTISLLGKG